MDIDNPPPAYFEAMRRLRLEPPDEETVERIVEIARRIWRRQEEEEQAEQEGWGRSPLLVVPRGLSKQVQDISRARSRSPRPRALQHAARNSSAADRPIPQDHPLWAILIDYEEQFVIHSSTKEEGR